MPPGIAHDLPLGAAQAALAEADLPGPRRGGARSDHLRGRRRGPARRARATCRSAATSTTPGLAMPLVLLLFGSIWLFPLITALVAGDIVAAEDHNGTLKTILTRSVERGQMFVAKALAAFSYAALAILVTGSGRDGRRRCSHRASIRSRRSAARRCRHPSGLTLVARQPRRLPDADHRDRVHRRARSQPFSATARPRSSER